MAHYIDSHPDLVSDKRVLELGAAAGLPSLISSLNGADWVTLTDYPDADLILNMSRNVQVNLSQTQQSRVSVQGFLWGQDVTSLISNGQYDLILLADLIFNHTEHYSLLKSCKECLRPTGSVLVIFTHHVVKWAERDLMFFERAVEPQFGFVVEKLGVEKWQCMFPEDAGSEEVRSTVNMYRLTLAPQV
jgi:nicotinamide N-methyltransferase